MSSRLGNIRTETRSWWPIIGHYFFIMRNIWKIGPDSLIITMEQNVQFQVGIYHEKFQLEQRQNGTPAATSDRQIFPLTRFTQHFLCIAPKFIP